MEARTAEDAEEAEDAVVIGDQASRHSTALALSVVGHALLLALLASGAMVRLSVVPSPLVLTLVEPGVETAGPGQRSPKLKVAAGRPKPAALPTPRAAAAPPPAAPPAAPRAATEAAKRQPPPTPPAKRSAPPAKRSAPPARPPRLAPSERSAVSEPTKPAAAPPSGNARPEAKTAQGAGTQVASLATPGQAGSASGADQESAAPSWAPQARVRYEELLFAWMNRHKQYPMLARRRGLEGSGSVRVRIDRDGRVVDRSIQRSTGELMLDRAALDMVRRASPFPAVPDDYAGEGFEFVAPIQYRLR